MIFVTPPSSWPRLALATQELDSVAIKPPPDFEDIGKRLRRAYAAARADRYERLSAGLLRKLPYAYWLEQAEPLSAVEPELVARYWTELLPQALDSGPRRAKRWLTPLFYTYCERFAPDDEVFLDFARRMSTLMTRGQGQFVERLINLQREVSFFSPGVVAGKLAAALMEPAKDLDQALEARLLWPGFLETRLGAATFDSALFVGQRRAPDPLPFLRLMAWAKRLGTSVAKTPHRVRFADAMLLPWRTHRPEERLKSALIDRLVSQYGDPRFPGTRQYQWRGVDPAAVSLLLNWLTGDTLRAFMRILEQTADDIWRYRRKFWMAYYEAGHVQEAWLALGSDAARLAERLKADVRGLGYGRLEVSVQPNHSVLLLKIGSLVFSEWSHNGSLRAYEDGARNAPALYQDSYNGRELREAESLDFHEGANERPQLMHAHSERGTWQRKARDFIRRQTGVHLRDTEIL
jgi:hypothetical protein